MPLTLTDDQKAQIAKWVGEGASLAEVQKRLSTEFSISLTYMDARFLLDDLNLAIKDKPKAPAPTAELTPSPAAGALPAPGDGPAPGGKVRISVDKVVRPGAVASGNVTFSDGQIADWYLDQAGRLGLVSKTKDYKPSAPDVQEFQYALQDELARMGY